MNKEISGRRETGRKENKERMRERTNIVLIFYVFLHMLWNSVSIFHIFAGSSACCLEFRSNVKFVLVHWNGFLLITKPVTCMP